MFICKLSNFPSHPMTEDALSGFPLVCVLQISQLVTLSISSSIFQSDPVLWNDYKTLPKVAKTVKSVFTIVSYLIIIKARIFMH